MYDFYYNHLKKEYGDKIKLLYTDTDIVILVRTEDLYEDMKKNMEFYCFTNKKGIGKFKDELIIDGKLMTEFFGLRPKQYSYTGEESG